MLSHDDAISRVAELGEELRLSEARTAALESDRDQVAWRLDRLAGEPDPLTRSLVSIWERLRLRLAERLGPDSETDRWSVFVREGEELVSFPRIATGALDADPTRDAALHAIRRDRRPLDRQDLAGEVIVSGRAIQLDDIFGESGAAFPRGHAMTREMNEALGRAADAPVPMVAVPLLAAGEVIGALLVMRPAGTPPYSDDDLAAIAPYAEEMALAIGNARAAEQLAQRNEDLAATADVLRIVSEYSTDLETVLDRVIERVCKLVDADRGFTFLVAGNRRRGSGIYDPNPQESRFNIAEGRELDLTVPVDTAILERRPVHVWGTRDEIREQFPNAGGVATEVSTRLCVPILHGEQAIGGIVLSRSRIAPYSEREIALVQSFADQAAIAIGNSRLLGELDERNEDLAATADVLRIVSEYSTDLDGVLDRVIERVCKLVDADRGSTFLVEGNRRRGSGAYVPTGENPFRVAEGQELDLTRPVDAAILERRPVHVWGTGDEVRERFPNAGGAGGEEATRLCVPILRGNEAIGGMILSRSRIAPYSEREIALVQSFADQAAIAIANSRLLAELEKSNRETEEALERQTAIATVLETISRSAFDLDAVLAELAEQANLLVHGDVTSIAQLEDGVFRYTMTFPRDTPEAAMVSRMAFGPDNEIPAIWAMRERRAGFGTVHPDDPILAQLAPEAREYFDTFGTTSAAVIPMYSGDTAVGLLEVRRRGEHVFDDGEKAALQTFADQAVIAIENARLFRETEEALERQVAVAEVFASLTQAPTEAALLDTIVANSAPPGHRDIGLLHLRDAGGNPRLAADHGLPPGFRGPPRNESRRGY